jgi:hypothetical protein
MKRNILLPVLLCLAGLLSPLFAQESAGLKAFEQFCNEQSQLISKANRNNDQAAVERAFQAILEAKAKLPEEVQKKAQLDEGGIYYNLACAQSLQKKKKAALRSFELAFQHGWTKYRHALGDTDLDNIRADKRFEAVMAQMKEHDYLVVLQRAAPYTPTQRPDTLPRFSYQHPNDRNLVRVREYFKLDSVAGAGDELSKIKNILVYVHNLIKHDGNHPNPESDDAIGMAEACRDGSRGLNCRGLAKVLNECYLSMGIPSRFVTCMPKVYISDCHVINAVYSSTLDKWLWMDPTHAAWVTDEGGNLLSIQEVRDRLCRDLPVRVNDTANWNNRNKTTTADYLYSYMAKNLYYLKCMSRSQYNAEAEYDPEAYVNLKPTGYTNDRKGGTDVNDENWFWQSPYAGE